MPGQMIAAQDLELGFYEQFFFSRGLEPYKVQEQAFEHIFKGRSVLVTVPTGTGKTMMAKAGIYKALTTGQTAVYTTPLRALTEEKYRELCDDFGKDKVGFQTGDYKVNTDAPIQVMVAEILWNRIYGDRIGRPADVVVMDEGHYFNDPERGYVWEQSIIGLDPRSQLVILSATIGHPEQFCAWVYGTRHIDMELVKSDDRKVPLLHEYREQYLLEVVKALFAAGDTPAIVFTFSRELCFERARLLKSCPRFTTDEERQKIIELCDPVLFDRGVAKELRALLLHGIGIHHAGILPRYKQLVEKLTLERLIRFVVSTETIAAGLNLPAKRVIFPELRKAVKGQARLLTSAEYHQMAGRAGRPQFDREGIAITLAPEEVVAEARRELKDAERGRGSVDAEKIWKNVTARVVSQAKAKGEVLWDRAAHERLVKGQPAPLASRTKVSADMVLAVGLPDLSVEPPSEALPPHLDLHIRSVIDNLLLPDHERREAKKTLEMVIANLRAMGVVDEHGKQIKGEMINKLRGVDGPFVYHALVQADMAYEDVRALVEYLVDHDVIWKLITRKDDDKRREWCRNRLRERRRDEPMVSWEDVEAEYEKTFPRELTKVEKIHAEFVASLPHPELHGGKKAKKVWAEMEDESLGFMDFVEKHGLAYEEGNLFSYLARVMRTARMIKDVTQIGEFETLELAIRQRLSVIDDRVMDPSW
jgi:superfamily II DNA/RNA helicase